MRVAFLGKGGSGKTTVSTMFVNYAKSKGKNMLVIDADINLHMYKAIGMSGTSIPLSDRNEPEIFDYFRNNRKDLKDRKMIPSTPPSLESKFMRIQENDMFLQKYALQNRNMSFLSVGSYEDRDIGVQCYHGKIESFEVMLHHMLDAEKDGDIVVADMVTGVDSVSSSLIFAFDLYFFVVEPTKKSVDVYLDFIKASKKMKPNVYVIANKITSEKDIAFLKKYIPEKKLFAVIPMSRELRRFERETNEEALYLVDHNKEMLEKMYKKMISTKKDWRTYLKKLRLVNKIMSEAYHDGKAHVNLDNEFAYEKVL